MNKQITVVGEQPDAGYVVDALLAGGYTVAWVSLRELPGALHTERCSIYPSSQVRNLTGHVGDFHLRVRSAGQDTIIESAAIVVATGNERVALAKEDDLLSHPRVITSQQLAERLAAPRRISDMTSQQHQHILFALDLTELSNYEATFETLQLALQARRTWHCEVSILYRELQVDSDSLENLTRQMRDLGIVFHRLQAKLPVADEAGVSVPHADGDLYGDLLVLAPTLRPRSDNGQLAQTLQIALGEGGYFQQLNVRSYRPGLSNRKGIFLAGRCHLDTNEAGACADASLAAANLDALLGREQLEPEAVIAHVDSNKCIRCLTCIRTCPHVAVELAQYDQVTAARVVDLACFGCGACAANCPVRAITMQGIEVPAWLQEIVLV